MFCLKEYLKILPVRIFHSLEKKITKNTTLNLFYYNVRDYSFVRTIP